MFNTFKPTWLKKGENEKWPLVSLEYTPRSREKILPQANTRAGNTVPSNTYAWIIQDMQYFTFTFDIARPFLMESKKESY